MEQQDKIRGMLAVMLKLQNEMNEKVNPHWIASGYDWSRAGWIECAELMEHIGWKWWKKQTPNLEQARIEAIDIFHFGLSALLVGGQGHIEAVLRDSLIVETFLNLGQKTPHPEVSNSAAILKATELMASEFLRSAHFSVEAFALLAQSLGLSFDDLFRGYVGKNVLNKFRQDHGYKQGTYLKMWLGREDNEYLAEILRRVDGEPEFFSKEIYKNLECEYSKAINAAQPI